MVGLKFPDQLVAGSVWTTNPTGEPDHKEYLTFTVVAEKGKTLFGDDEPSIEYFYHHWEEPRNTYIFKKEKFLAKGQPRYWSAETLSKEDLWE